MPEKRLSAAFYRRDPERLARSLLGKVLVCRGRAARITECEAYLGAHDLASHARFGPTKRTQLMFGEGGFAYVYLYYGIHTMFNVVAGKEGEGGAVLIRGVQLLDGRAAKTSDGPGKLTRALDIRMEDNGTDLRTSPKLYIRGGTGSRRVAKDSIRVGPRIGIDYAGEWKDAPLRFLLPA